MSAVWGVFGHAVVFGLAPLLQRVAGLVLLPLYTHYLAPGDYGEIELLTLAAGLVAMVLRMELRPAYLRAWVEGDDRFRAGMLRRVGGVLGAVAVVGGAVAFLVSGPACAWLVGHPVGLGVRVVLAVGIVAEVALMTPQATLQAQLRSKMMVVIGVGQFVAGSVVSVVAVVGFGAGPLGVFLGGTVGLVVGWVGCSLAVRGPRGPVSAVRLLPLLRFGLPLLAGGLLFFVVRNADRVIVAGVLSVAELGEYAVAWSMTNLLMTLLFLPLQSSLDVWRHRLFLEPGGGVVFADVFRLAMLGMGLAAVGLDTVGVDVLLRVVDGRYAAAVALVPVLSAAVLLQVGYSIVASAFFVAGATGRWTAIFAVGAVLQVGVSLACVPWLGLWGAPMGVLAANGWLYGAAAVWAGRLWSVPYGHRVMAVVLALVGGVAVMRMVVPGGALLVSLVVDGVVCLGAVALVFGLGFLGRSDLGAAVDLVRRRGGG